MLRFAKSLASILALLVASAGTAQAEDRSFAAGSLIIPMDQSYQGTGMFQAYGLLYELLRQGIPVAWFRFTVAR